MIAKLKDRPVQIVKHILHLFQYFTKTKTKMSVNRRQNTLSLFINKFFTQLEAKFTIENQIDCKYCNKNCKLKNIEILTNSYFQQLHLVI